VLLYKNKYLTVNFVSVPQLLFANTVYCQAERDSLLLQAVCG